MDLRWGIHYRNTSLVFYPRRRILRNLPNYPLGRGVSRAGQHRDQALVPHLLTECTFLSFSLWYPQIQFTFKYFNPKTGQKIWKSINVTNFVTPPPAGSGRDKSKTYDKRSSKSDQFSAFFDTLPNGDESYTIEANLDTDLQLSWSFTRAASNVGWKLGEGPEGGKSIFGSNPSSPEGYVVHRFWPRAASAGHIIAKGQAIDAKGQGMFVHAIQGMRPNLVASKWNFANFQSEDLGGVAAIMMELSTTNDYGDPISGNAAGAPSKRKSLTVNIGSISVGGKLVAVTATTGGREQASSASSTAEHLDAMQDIDTGYQAPTKIRYQWDGPALDDKHQATTNNVSAKLTVHLGKPHPTSESKGLVDKVDVLAEIPYVIRKVVNYVAGTKPYIYQVGLQSPCTCPRHDTDFLLSPQTLNPVQLDLSIPEGSDQAGNHTVNGTLFEEHTFINV